MLSILFNYIKHVLLLSFKRYKDKENKGLELNPIFVSYNLIGFSTSPHLAPCL